MEWGTVAAWGGWFCSSPPNAIASLGMIAPPPPPPPPVFMLGLLPMMAALTP